MTVDATKDAARRGRAGPARAHPGCAPKWARVIVGQQRDGRTGCWWGS